MRHAPPTKGRYAHQDPLYDTSIPTPSHAERARTLAQAMGTGTLCTAAREPEGHPYGSFVSYGMEGGAPVLLVSALAEHTQNLRRDPRCSLLIAEVRDGDPMARARVTLVAEGRQLARGDEDASARAAYLEANPNAAYYADYKDFAFWRLEVSAVRYIGGYGRMSWVETDEWMAATADPVAPVATRIIDHMNADHAEACVLYCRAFSRATEATEAVMTGVDRYGFELSVTTDTGPRPVRVAFAGPMSNAKEVRQELVRLVGEAREKLGVHK